jgi:hypothetical protein
VGEEKMDEIYIHYQESIDSLNQAWRIVCELESVKPNGIIWNAAYRMALIEYCKPFKSSQGIIQKHHKVEIPPFDEEKQKLHENIIQLRDQILAHSDISILNATVSYDKNSEYPFPLVCKNTIPNMPNLLDIRNLIEFVLDELYKKQNIYNKKFASLHSNTE